VAAAAGILALSVMMLLARARVDARLWLYDVGRAIVPLGERFGAFAGVEVLAACTWATAWLLLARRWRGQEIAVRPTFAFVFGALLLATLFAWI
jgi:hypothetical protein